MAGMASANLFLFARYIVFALFTICNAITCSVAVWNYSLVNHSPLAQVDVYLIFLGAFSLVSIFTLIFIELLCVDSMTTRVWFECVWVALFWIMELAGGAALTAVQSDIPCSGKATTFLSALCTSQRVLLAFTWMCTIILLAHLLVLVFVAASRYYRNPKVWTSDVRALRAVAVRQCLSSPNSPLTTRFKKRPSVDIYTPRPMHIQAVQVLHHPVGINTNYEIEPFHPVFVAPEQMDITHLSDLPEAIPLPPPAAAPTIPSFMKPMPPLPTDRRNMVSLSLNRFDPPRELKSSITYANSGLPCSGPTPSQRASLPSPPPLGDWPCQDIMQQPVNPKPRRTSPPPSAFEFPKKHMATMTSTERASVDGGTQPRPRRPSGPRQRLPSVESGHRPSPLDLTGVSNIYDTGCRDDAV